jgi:phenylacetate-CoA ligase
MSIITPGINKAEVIKAVQNLGDDYDQILIGSYAPFLKDIIDDGIRAGLDWQKYKLGFIFSAEGFSETFRDYVAEKTGLTDVIHDTLNHYGTVDLGTMAHETPLAILIRRLAIAKPDLYQAIFGQIHKLPTLAQYIPEQFYFESNGPSLYCSAESGVPLVRYDLKDHGGIISLSEMEEIFADHNIILRDEASKAGIKNIWNLPFVYVYERSDMSVSFFAFQVYPETVRHALHEKEFSSHLTGKFSMTVEYDDVGRQELIIHIEIKPGTQLTAKLNDELRFAITERLRKDNSEYNRTYEEYGDKIMPKLQYWNYEDNTHFRPGTKQKWVKK